MSERTPRVSRRGLLKGAAGAAAGAGAAMLTNSLPLSAAGTGPSTSTLSYVIPSATGVDVTAILTTGDKVGDYRMVGIPDGLGVIGGANMTVLMNHELPFPLGVQRAHGSVG